MAAKNESPQDAILWQEDPRGPGPARYFWVRPGDKQKRFHLRIVVGIDIATDRKESTRQEVRSAARLMGVTTLDAYWQEVEKLAS